MKRLSDPSRRMDRFAVRLRLALVATAVCLGGPALAASQSDEDACRPDVFRLCGWAIPDEAAIVTCLNANLPSLSPACQLVMDPMQTTPPVIRRRRTMQPRN